MRLPVLRGWLLLVQVGGVRALGRHIGHSRRGWRLAALEVDGVALVRVVFLDVGLVVLGVGRHGGGRAARDGG